MKKLTLTLLKLYRRFLSPNNLGLKVCRFEPSCSKYTYQAIEKYGIFKGGLMGTWRVLRCNPFSKGGYDPVK
ncbi:MAG TPA: membrane protein insertion efficiency factor YidD [Candidatus Saccharimonadales bacterium]|nr:membrane protein insertion efficiency factor YidD [Candidatus Saccharimonadales bacterium]